MYRTVDGTGSSLVVRGLPDPVTADDLKEAYGGFGEVVCAEVKHVGEGKASRKTGYLTFALDSAATNAQIATDGRTIDCKHCTVLLEVTFGHATNQPLDNPTADLWARDRYPARNSKHDHGRKIFVRSFPGGFSEAQLAELFKDCGPIEYTEIRGLKSMGCPSNRPYGFICFEKMESAGEAVRTMNGVMPPSCDSQMVVDFARPRWHHHSKRGCGRGGLGRGGRDNPHRGSWLGGSRNGRIYGRKPPFFACSGGELFNENHDGSPPNRNGNNQQHSSSSYGVSPAEKMSKKSEWKVMEQKKKNGGRYKN